MSDVLIRSFRIRNALCGVFSYFCEGGALGSWATQNPPPPFASSHEGWGVCTERQRQPGEEDLVIVITLAVIMPVDGTVAEADALVAVGGRTGCLCRVLQHRLEIPPVVVLI
jgi:hypothetical protein